MNEEEQWYLEVMDAEEELKRSEEDNFGYTLCDRELLDYSIEGLSAIREFYSDQETLR